MKAQKTLSRKEVAGRLIHFRVNVLNLTQAEFARRLGLTTRNLQIYEQATSDVSAEFFNRAHREFGLDPLWLLTGEGASPVNDKGGANRDIVRRASEAVDVVAMEHRIPLSPSERGELVQALYDKMTEQGGYLEIGYLQELFERMRTV
jgi:transcriptional regulator with XRE-family HTH domain